MRSNNSSNNNNNNNTFIYIALFLFLTNSALQDIYNLTSHRIINKGCETGPPVYRPYPRRLESLTICRPYLPPFPLIIWLGLSLLSVAPFVALSASYLLYKRKNTVNALNFLFVIYFHVLKKSFREQNKIFLSVLTYQYLSQEKKWSF